MLRGWWLGCNIAGEFCCAVREVSFVFVGRFGVIFFVMFVVLFSGLVVSRGGSMF